MGIYYGTSGSDTIWGGELIDKFYNIDSAGGDDVVYLNEGQTFLSGEGNDEIHGSKTGRTWYNTSNATNPVVIDVQNGVVTSDGFGTQDKIFDIDAFVIGSKSYISFGNKNGVLSVIGSENTIHTGTGQVSVQFYGKYNDYTLIEKIDGAIEVLNKITLEKNYIYDKPTIQFSDKSINAKVSINDFSSQFWTEQSLNKTSMVGAFSELMKDGQIPGICTIETADLNSDGKDEIILHLQMPGGPWGAYFNGPTPNELLILGVNQNGTFENITDKIIPGKQFSLTGWTRQVTSCDLNGDSRIDLMWSVNKEDGRTGDSDNQAQIGVLLSKADGTYATLSVGDNNWFHAIAGAPLLTYGNSHLPGIAISSGFQGPPVALVFQKDGSYTIEPVSKNIIGGGTLEYLPSLDDFTTGSRFFLAQTPNEDPAIVRRDANGIWTSSSFVHEAFRDTAKEYKYINYFGGDSTVFLYSYGEFKLTGAQYTEAAVWKQFPDKNPIAILKLGTSIPLDFNATVFVQNSDLPANFLSFYNIDNGILSSSTAKIINEEYIVNSNFMDVLDLNYDGYEDLVVYSYAGEVVDSPLAIIYLNDNKGNLYRADSNAFIPQPSGMWGEASKFGDLNGDGIYDMIVFPGNGGSNVLPERLDQFHIYYGKTRLLTGPNFVNPADEGAPGFNEHYYLDSHPTVAALVANGTYATGLAHYLAVGKSLHYESFAPNINVWGSDNHRYDVLTLNGTSSNFNVHIGEITSVVDNKGAYGTLKLNGIEKLQFTDRAVIIESQSHGSYADLPTELYQFFITAFNAAPGVTYMDQLAEAYRYGLSVKQIVDIFTTKKQFTDVYSPSLSHSELATQLVNNIVKSSASTSAKTEAIADIKGALDIGWTVGDVIFTVFGNLAHKDLSDPNWGNTAKQFNNEIAVAKYYTEVLNQSTTDLETLRDVIQPVTQSTDVSSAVVIAQLVGVALMNGGLVPSP